MTRKIHHFELNDHGMLPFNQPNDAPVNFQVLAAPANPTAADEITYLSGLNADGTIVTDPALSYWSFVGGRARKWGAATPGTDGEITYSFDAASNFTSTEKATFQAAMALWESVADVRFVESSTGSTLIQRGTDGGAYVSAGYSFSGSNIGTFTTALLSIDDSTLGFELTGSFDTIGGYGMATIVHELGHLLGLGHGGPYNGAVNPSTQQFGAYDERMWTTMSYIYWNSSNPKFRDTYPVTGTNWGQTVENYNRQAPHTMMQLDVQAIQRIYGASTSSLLNGGDVFGFNTNLDGSIRRFFDFTENTHPVVNLFSTGTGNTLDLTGFSQASTVNLTAGAFSSVAGLINNISISVGTLIETVRAGSGNDHLTGNAATNNIFAGAGTDTLIGGDGADNLYGGAGADLHIGGDSTGVDYARYDDEDYGNLVISLSAPSSNTGAAAGDTYTGIEGIVGGAGNDTITGNASGNYLFGGGGSDKVYGGDGKDYLNGGSGADNLYGGAGADQYIGGDGVGIDYARYDDAVYGSMIIRLDAPNKNTGVAAGDTYSGIEGLVGSGGHDTIVGDTAANYLFGGGGNDKIDGLRGKDYFNGGGGADKFQFSTGLNATTNVDTIADFQHGTDDIVLAKAIFAAIGATLDATELRFGAAAQDANDYLIYNAANGQLSYDGNGSAGGGMTLFAIVEANTILDVNDFLMA